MDGFDPLISFDVDPDKGKIDYHRVARHECGHAVVAIARQKRVKYIRLGRLFRMETHAGVVQFGRYCVQFPSPGDMTFYERIAAYGVKAGVQNTTYEYWGWPIKPTFGLPQIIKPT